MKQVSKLLSIKNTDTQVLSTTELINLKGGQFASAEFGCPPPIGIPTNSSTTGGK